MDLFTSFLIALGLAMDAFAVSITSGITMFRVKVSDALRIAFYFGFFQAFMPVIGWFGASIMTAYIAGVDHWIAFGLLSLIGGKMIYESFFEDKNKIINPLNFWILIMLAVAVSIDALAVGISFAFLKISIVGPVIIIGGVTFLLSFLGVYLGKKYGHFLGSRVEVLGGLILIGIGVKILLEHL